nr:MAG TPA: hypothetical protein [Caudoviricetes sp.]
MIVKAIFIEIYLRGMLIFFGGGYAWTIKNGLISSAG